MQYKTAIKLNRNVLFQFYFTYASRLSRRSYPIVSFGSRRICAANFPKAPS